MIKRLYRLPGVQRARTVDITDQLFFLCPC
jgi:hypothetical protein